MNFGNNYPGARNAGNRGLPRPERDAESYIAGHIQFDKRPAGDRRLCRPRPPAFRDVCQPLRTSGDAGSGRVLR